MTFKSIVGGGGGRFIARIKAFISGNSRCKSSWWSFLSTTAEAASKRVIVIDEQMYKIMRIKHFGSVTDVNRTLQNYPEH